MRFTIYSVITELILKLSEREKFSDIIYIYTSPSAEYREKSAFSPKLPPRLSPAYDRFNTTFGKNVSQLYTKL